MTDNPPISPEDFAALIQTMRPELHRYATRMTGSAIDGEDVVQDALIKASESRAMLAHDTNLRGWLFRITHNKAIDHLRRSRNEPLELLDEYALVDAPDKPLEARELTAMAMTLFLKLAPRQRSCVILKDVLGYSLVEISELLDATVPEIKATLHRGRARLRDLAEHADATPPPQDDEQRALLARYVERFNARDFDTLRAMLTEDVRVELPNRTKVQGIGQVTGQYFYRYGQVNDWQMAVGTVEGRPAIIGYDLNESPTQPAYFILLEWSQNQVTFIRDYYFARYVLRDAVVTVE